MTFWKPPGVSEKLPYWRAGPKSPVFELFFRLENLEWVTDMLRNTAPVSQNRSGTRNIEWVFAHSWRTADFQKQFAQNSKSTCHSKFGSQVLFFVEGSPKSFEHVFFEHLLSFFSFVIHFHAFFQPFFIHSSSILHQFPAIFIHCHLFFIHASSIISIHFPPIIHCFPPSSLILFNPCSSILI